jgi:hypothetical protein
MSKAATKQRVNPLKSEHFLNITYLKVKFLSVREYTALHYKDCLVNVI